MKVFAVEWCPCVYESAYGVVSLHYKRKKAEAERARLIAEAEQNHKETWEEIGEPPPYEALAQQDIRVRAMKVKR